mmetsp:Transcript_6441/g.15640  ORF Transcript_6441/g.15640 Transcript_6441/m.15640 type:complete len:226 (+) Transcript_6441:1747-2424(+)
MTSVAQNVIAPVMRLVRHLHWNAKRFERAMSPGLWVGSSAATCLTRSTNTTIRAASSSSSRSLEIASRHESVSIPSWTFSMFLCLMMSMRGCSTSVSPSSFIEAARHIHMYSKNSGVGQSKALASLRRVSAKPGCRLSSSTFAHRRAFAVTFSASSSSFAMQASIQIFIIWTICSGSNQGSSSLAASQISSPFNFIVSTSFVFNRSIRAATRSSISDESMAPIIT